MREIGSETIAKIASDLTGEQRELLLCLCRWAARPILKPELREIVQADQRYEVPRAESTYSDRLRRLIKHNLVNEDQCDSRTVWVTRLGFLVRGYLIEEQKKRILRETSSDTFGVGVSNAVVIKKPHAGEAAS